MLKDIKELFIGKTADFDALDDSEYSLAAGKAHIAWDYVSWDDYEMRYGFDVKLGSDNSITYISGLSVERMIGEDAASSTWEKRRANEDDYAEMEYKLRELCCLYECSDDDEV